MPPGEDRPWLVGLERLDDPPQARRFVTSRLLYRRLRRYLWAPPLVLAAVALLLRIEFVVDGLGRLFRSPRQQEALRRAYGSVWFDRFVVTLVIAALLVAVLAVVVAVTSRGIWRALGGEGLPRPWAGGPSGTRPVAHSLLMLDGHDALDTARQAVAAGAAGVVVGGALVPELTHLQGGFFACPGATSEVVREHRGRLGLPPTFLHHRQESTLELETGADLHVRLMLAEVDLPLATLGERLVTSDSVVKGRARAADVHPELAAGWPSGASWPPAPEVAADRVRVRRIRRIAAVSLFVAGAIQLLSSVTEPLRQHLQLVAQYLPISVVQAAGALSAIAGIGMIMLSAAGSSRASAVPGSSPSPCSASLCCCISPTTPTSSRCSCAPPCSSSSWSSRELFRAETERATMLTAFVILAFGGVIATLGGFIAVEVAGRVRHHPLPSWPSVLAGSAERLVGVRWVGFPPTIDRFASVSLLTVGISLIVVALYLLTRPVVDRRLSSGGALVGGAPRSSGPATSCAATARGRSTTSPCATTSSGTSIATPSSPMPCSVGSAWSHPTPSARSPSGHVWDSFRRFVDRNGWGLGVMGAGEQWLPTYQASGMRFVYIGDEAVVDLAKFSLEGGKMKSLRQAVNRVARYGYTVRFLDPANLRHEGHVPGGGAHAGRTAAASTTAASP